MHGAGAPYFGDNRFPGVASVSIIYPDYVFKSIKKRNLTSSQTGEME